MRARETSAAEIPPRARSNDSRVRLRRVPGPSPRAGRTWTLVRLAAEALSMRFRRSTDELPAHRGNPGLLSVHAGTMFMHIDQQLRVAAMGLSGINCVEDFRVLAKKRLPRMFYEFVQTLAPGQRAPIARTRQTFKRLPSGSAWAST